MINREDESDDRVVRDGESIRVPLYMMDAQLCPL